MIKFHVKIHQKTVETDPNITVRVFMIIKDSDLPFSCIHSVKHSGTWVYEWCGSERDERL